MLQFSLVTNYKSMYSVAFTILRQENSYMLVLPHAQAEACSFPHHDRSQKLENPKYVSTHWQGTQWNVFLNTHRNGMKHLILSHSMVS